MSEKSLQTEMFQTLIYRILASYSKTKKKASDIQQIFFLTPLIAASVGSKNHPHWWRIKLQTEKKGERGKSCQCSGVSKWSAAGQWPSRDVTVQKAVKASYMSECGQGLRISANWRESHINTLLCVDWTLL